MSPYEIISVKFNSITNLITVLVHNVEEDKYIKAEMYSEDVIESRFIKETWGIDYAKETEG